MNNQQPVVFKCNIFVNKCNLIVINKLQWSMSYNKHGKCTVLVSRYQLTKVFVNGGCRVLLTLLLIKIYR